MKESIVAANTERAHVRALEVVREHGPAERVERLESITVGMASTRNPAHLASFQAELTAALAEMVEDLIAKQGAAKSSSKKKTR